MKFSIVLLSLVAIAVAFVQGVEIEHADKTSNIVSNTDNALKNTENLDEERKLQVGLDRVRDRLDNFEDFFDEDIDVDVSVDIDDE